LPKHEHLIRLATILLVAAVFLSAGPALAQEPVTIDTLTISIWPEFDRTAALVFYAGDVQGDTPLPVNLTFTLPETASVHAVAYQSPDGGLANAVFELEGDQLSMTSPNGTFHIEFYDAALTLTGTQRDYEITWQSPYPVTELSWEVQQPPNATDMTLSPGQSTLSRDEYGLSLYRIDAGAVSTDTPADLTVSYEKPSMSLTVDLLGEDSAGAPVPGGTPENRLPNTTFLIINGVIIALLAGIAGYFYSQMRRQPTPVAAPTPTATPQNRPGAAGSTVKQPSRTVAAPPGAKKPSAEPDLSALANDSVLTERELEVLTLLAEGLSNREIGAKLGISPRTVARHRENMMRKLDLHSRTELVMHAVRIGLIDITAD
jgi:DNA-binding CsgD family transcriptional regulator